MSDSAEPTGLSGNRNGHEHKHIQPLISTEKTKRKQSVHTSRILFLINLGIAIAYNASFLKSYTRDFVGDIRKSYDDVAIQPQVAGISEKEKRDEDASFLKSYGRDVVDDLRNDHDDVAIQPQMAIQPQVAGISEKEKRDKGIKKKKSGAKKAKVSKPKYSTKEKEAIEDKINRIMDGSMSGNKTENSCPLDQIFDFGYKDCKIRDGGDVCIFPSMIVKRMKAKKRYWKNEMDVFPLLNDTRFFPKLMHRDDRCKTIVVENATPPGRNDINVWSANYTYYKDFYASAFEIFKVNKIVPDDLNACCNTLAHGKNIRIIDFGQYYFEEDPTKLRKKHEEILENILDFVKKKQKSYVVKKKQKSYENN